MPRKDPGKQALDELRALERESPSEAGIARLRKLLDHRSNHVVGRAARLARDWDAEALIPELLAAFERFMEAPEKSDPGCAAKQPLIEALDTLGHSNPDVYLAGIRHFQHEPVYGGSEDTAAGVRGANGHALLNCGYADGFLEMAALVRDPEARTRRMAMESLGGSGAYQAEIILRVAVLAGDPEPDITSLGLQGLMRIAPERELPFVRGFLADRDPLVAEGAALAIGEARLPESFRILRDAWDAAGWRGPMPGLLLPMALTRDEAAFGFILQVIRNERERVANEAVKALSIFAGQEDRVAAIEAVLDERGSPELLQAFRRIFEV